MPDEPSTKKPDAILYPLAKIPGRDSVDRALWTNRVIGPILGAKRVHSTSAPGQMIFMRGSIFDKDGAPIHLYHAGNHPQAGEDRYEWVETPEGSGILYGTLRPEPPPEEPPANA